MIGVVLALVAVAVGLGLGLPALNNALTTSKPKTLEIDSKKQEKTKSKDLPDNYNLIDQKDQKIPLSPNKVETVNSTTLASTLEQINANARNLTSVADTTQQFGSMNAQEASKLDKNSQKIAEKEREIVIPQELKASTSLLGAEKITGQNLKRDASQPHIITNASNYLNENSTTLQKEIVNQQKKAELLSLALYGNVQKASYVKPADKTAKTISIALGAKPITPIVNTISTNDKLQADIAKVKADQEAKKKATK